MVKLTKIFSVIGVMGLVLCFLTGTSLAQVDKIKIGVMYSMTGAGSAIGKIQLDGAKLAIKEINDQGGLMFGGKKVKVEAVIRDDETKPDVAVRRFRELIQDEKITAFVGCTFAHVSKALNEQAQTQQILFMPTNGIPESIFFKKEKAPYTLNVLGATEGIGRISADYVAKTYKPKHVMLFLPDYAYGRDAGAGAHKIFSSRYPGIKVSEVWTPVGTPDFTSYIIKIEEAKPDVVMMGHWGNDGINVLKQVYEMRLGKKTKLFFNWIINVFAVGIPPEAMEGVTCQMLWYHDMSEFKDPVTVKASQKLTEMWRKEYGEPPDPYAMMCYFGMVEVLRGIRLSNSLEPAKIYKAIMDNPVFDSVKGPAKWRVDGRPLYRFSSFIIEGKGPKERKDMKWDFARIVDSYEGEEFLLPLKETGWE
ncbi:MAG: ABC transporter substrate-binding protein [Desulfobacterales bacterium]|nr:ABC transporter substrate-binding protein [Desulfobacterales bacterium]